MYLILTIEIRIIIYYTYIPNENGSKYKQYFTDKDNSKDNKSKTFSSCWVIPIIKNEEESFNEIFKAPPKLVVSSSEDEKAPVSEPL